MPAHHRLLQELPPVKRPKALRARPSFIHEITFCQRNWVDRARMSGLDCFRSDRFVASNQPRTRKRGPRLLERLCPVRVPQERKQLSAKYQTIVLQGGIMASSENSRRDRKLQTAGLTRREFLPLLGATAAMASIAPRAFAAVPAEMSKSKPSDAVARFVYIGTYTAPDVPPGGTHPSSAVGIYVFRMDPSDGNLTQLQIVPASNPSYVAIDPAQTHLYSVNEDLAGRVSAYALNQGNGTLSFLNTAPANGSFTTHISVHPSGAYLFAANYGTGNFPAYRILANGSIGPMTALFQSVGNGTGPQPDRQEGPHAHQIGRASCRERV